MNKEKELIEYNGVWHKKGKDGKCEPFTMRDLKELLKKERESGYLQAEKDSNHQCQEIKADELREIIKKEREKIIQEDNKRLEGKKKECKMCSNFPNSYFGHDSEVHSYNKLLEEEINYKKEQLKQL